MRTTSFGTNEQLITWTCPTWLIRFDAVDSIKNNTRTHFCIDIGWLRVFTFVCIDVFVRHGICVWCFIYRCDDTIAHHSQGNRRFGECDRNIGALRLCAYIEFVFLTDFNWINTMATPQVSAFLFTKFLVTVSIYWQGNISRNLFYFRNWNFFRNVLPFSQKTAAPIKF